jgi:hypothetical protein
MEKDRNIHISFGYVRILNGINFFYLEKGGDYTFNEGNNSSKVTVMNSGMYRGSTLKINKNT